MNKTQQLRDIGQSLWPHLRGLGDQRLPRRAVWREMRTNGGRAGRRRASSTLRATSSYAIQLRRRRERLCRAGIDDKSVHKSGCPFASVPLGL